MFTLAIATDNAAFDDNDGGRAEIASILRDAAEQVEAGVVTVILRDSNGNRVGRTDYNPFKSA